VISHGDVHMSEQYTDSSRTVSNGIWL